MSVILLFFLSSRLLLLLLLLFWFSFLVYVFQLCRFHFFFHIFIILSCSFSFDGQLVYYSFLGSKFTLFLSRMRVCYIYPKILFHFFSFFISIAWKIVSDMCFHQKNNYILIAPGCVFVYSIIHLIACTLHSRVFGCNYHFSLCDQHFIDVLFHMVFRCKKVSIYRRQTHHITKRQQKEHLACNRVLYTYSNCYKYVLLSLFSIIG